MLINRILHESQIFGLFDELEIRQLAERMFANLKSFEKADVLIRAMESGPQTGRMYIILEGALKVTMPKPGGEHDVVFNVLTTGAIFGELSLLDGAQRSASVIALTDGVVASIHRSEFFELAKTHPDMLEKVIQFLCAEIRRLSMRFEQVSSLTVRQRIAAYLVVLSKTFKGQAIRITQQELSGAVGATREQTSRIMSVFYKDGYLKKIETESSPRASNSTAAETAHSPKSGGRHAQFMVTSNGEQALAKISQENSSQAPTVTA